jgi:hypothetical protein
MGKALKFIVATACLVWPYFLHADVLFLPPDNLFAHRANVRIDNCIGFLDGDGFDSSVLSELNEEVMAGTLGGDGVGIRVTHQSNAVDGVITRSGTGESIGGGGGGSNCGTGVTGSNSTNIQILVTDQPTPFSLTGSFAGSEFTNLSVRLYLEGGADVFFAEGNNLSFDGTGAFGGELEPGAYRFELLATIGVGGGFPEFIPGANYGFGIELSFQEAQNQPPTANAGDDQAVRVDDIVFLDGTASFDDNTPTDALVYSWSLTSVPTDSAATLLNATTATPSFTVDVAGTYTVELVVADGQGIVSTPDEVMISSDNLAPSADAGPDQLVIVGSTVVLDGSNSSDPENDNLTYFWQFAATPVGSLAVLNNANTPSPSFVVDTEGVYDITLLVSDFVGPGTPDTIVVTAVSAEGFAELQIITANEQVAALTPEDVTSVGNQTALTNFLRQAVVAIQTGDFSEAIKKLEDALARTDGCVLRGAPDGNGPGRDWITSCVDQAVIYDSLSSALSALKQ